MTTRLTETLEDIARRELGVQTLVSGDRGDLDKNYIDIAALKRALHYAYLAGADDTAARILRINPDNGDTV